VIIANTFSTGRHMLEPAGLGDTGFSPIVNGAIRKISRRHSANRPNSWPRQGSTSLRWRCVRLRWVLPLRSKPR
jgi:hypothetical protein